MAAIQDNASGNSPAGSVSFDGVAPILREHCIVCHNENEARGGLSLTAIDKVLAGSASGPVVVPGKPEESLLYLLASHREAPKMPPNRPRISQRELKAIETWIAEGMDSSPQPTKSKPKAWIEGMREVVPVRQHDMVRALAVHPVQPSIAIAIDGQILFSDPEGNVSQEALRIPGREVTALRFREDGNEIWVAAGKPAETGKVAGWDLVQSHALPTVGDESDTIPSFDCDGIGGRFAIGTSSRRLKIFGPGDGPPIEFKKHTDWVLSVRFSRDGLLLASGDRFGGIQVTNPKTGEEFATLRGHTGAITSLVWNSDGDALISGSLDGSIRVWDMHSLQTQSNWTAHAGGVSALAIDGLDRVWSTGDDARVRRWNWNHAVAEDVTVELPSPGVALSIGNRDLLLAVSDTEGSVYAVAPDSNPSLIPIPIPSRPASRNLTFYPPPNPDRSQPMIREREKIAEHSEVREVQEDLAQAVRALEETEAALLHARRSVEQLEQAAESLRNMIRERERIQPRADENRQP